MRRGMKFLNLVLAGEEQGAGGTEQGVWGREKREKGVTTMQAWCPPRSPIEEMPHPPSARPSTAGGRRENLALTPGPLPPAEYSRWARGDIGPQPSKRLQIRARFCPPKPKLFVMATSQRASRAVLGT